MNSLKNRVALVTGAAKGLGKAIALELARNGSVVIVNYLRSEKESEETLTAIRKFSKGSIKIKADVTNEKEVERMFSEAAKKFGKIDILINNVGNFIYKPIDKVSSDEFRNIIENNLFSAFYCCKKAISTMKGYGRIINIGCTGCDRVTIRKMTSPYYIAKTGLWMLTKSLAMETTKGITVNMVSPGVLESSVVKPENSEIIKFSDITNAIMFLLSEKSEKTNGANIEVSGGSVLGAD